MVLIVNETHGIRLTAVTLSPPKYAHTLKRSITLNAPAQVVFDWHKSATAFEELCPPWKALTLISQDGGIDEAGSELKFKIHLLGNLGPLTFISKALPLYLIWVAEHQNYIDTETHKHFDDIQKKGPFAFWHHNHMVRPIDETTCELIDTVTYALPFGWLGNSTLGTVFGGFIIHQDIKWMFDYRHQKMACLFNK